MAEVVFRPKSFFQKNNCINRGKDYSCPNQSTLEAVCEEGNWLATIRCCTDPRCKKVASTIALATMPSAFGN
jgi:hypothetical protein